MLFQLGSKGTYLIVVRIKDWTKAGNVMPLGENYSHLVLVRNIKKMQGNLITV